MVPTGDTSRAPVHRLAWTGFALAILALLLAWYGSLHAEKHIAGTPLRSARGEGNVIGQPGPWYERLVDRAEVSVFGERFDKQVLEATEQSRSARYSLHFVAFFLPFILGIVSAYLGGSAMTAIERAGPARSGHFQAVFAIMIGGFAAVIAGSMIFSLYLWPYMPSPYTT